MNKLKVILIFIVAAAVYAYVSIETTKMRGYWAVGGEVNLPIIIVAWGLWSIERRKND